jgi:hypothetical protein
METLSDGSRSVELVRDTIEHTVESLKCKAATAGLNTVDGGSDGFFIEDYVHNLTLVLKSHLAINTARTASLTSKVFNQPEREKDVINPHAPKYLREEKFRPVMDHGEIVWSGSREKFSKAELADHVFGLLEAERGKLCPT